MRAAERLRRGMAGGLLASLATSLWAALVHRGGAGAELLAAVSVSLVAGGVPWVVGMALWGLLIVPLAGRSGGAGRLASAAWLLPPAVAAVWLLLLGTGDARVLLVVAACAGGGAAALTGRFLPGLRGRPLSVSGFLALALHAAGLCYLAGAGWFAFPAARLPAAAAGRPVPDGAPPNLVLLVLDTTRADHLSAYGYARPTTPNLERIAARAVLFEDATAPAIWTLPTHASMFTGLYEFEHGVNRGHLWLEDRFVTLAEQLKARGYLTVGVSGNPLLLPGSRNLDQGFDAMLSSESQHIPAALLRAGEPGPWWRERAMALAESMRARDLGGTFLGERWRKHFLPRDTAWNAGRQDAGAAVANALVRDFLERRRTDRPFFLFVNYFEPHSVYNPTPEYRSKFLDGALEPVARSDHQRTWVGDSRDGHARFRGRALGFRPPAYTAAEILALRQLYDAEIAYLDDRVGELYDTLAARGLLENTVLVITADHGEQFLDEHGLILHEFSVYESLLRVPLLVHAPARFAPQRVATPVQTIDLYRTLLWCAGAEPAGSQPVRGSLLPLLPGTAYEPRVVAEYSVPDYPAFFMQEETRSVDLRPFFRTFRSYREQGWKLIWSSDGRHELYHLAEDPREQHNRIAAEPERAAMLHARLDDWLAGLAMFEVQMGSGEGRLSTEQEEQSLEDLRQLGYLGEK